MKSRIFVIVLVLSILSSCSKKDDEASTTGIIGQWQTLSHAFLIKPNEDISYPDLFSKPWQGTIKIDTTTINPENLYYIINTSQGNPHLYTSNILIDIFSTSFIITYNNSEYIYNDSFTLEKTNGRFIAHGFTVCNNKQISIDINLTAQVTLMKKDNEYCITDGLWHLKSPYESISFESNGKVKGKILDIDILSNFKGTWKCKLDNLHLDISVNEETQTDDFTFKAINKDTLLLSKTIDYYKANIFPTIPESKISSLKYQSVFERYKIQWMDVKK